MMDSHDRNKGLSLIVLGAAAAIFGYFTKDEAYLTSNCVARSDRPAITSHYNPGRDMMYIGGIGALGGAGLLGYAFVQGRRDERFSNDLKKRDSRKNS